MRKKKALAEDYECGYCVSGTVLIPQNTGHMLNCFPPEKGTYVLVMTLPESASVTIGRLGRFDFPAGWYVYIGSAFGAGGLRGRLKHHLTWAERPHWHVDYLRQGARVEQVWYRVSTVSLEHEWAAHLRLLPGATIPVPRFGASDCRCAAHLIHFPTCLDAGVLPGVHVVQSTCEDV